MEALLFNPDPCAYLPHRPPFLFIDRIVALEPGVAATGEFAVTGERYLPPLLLVEAMAQVGGIAFGQKEGEGGVLAALEKVELPAVVPRSRLLVHSRIAKSFGRIVRIEGEVLEDGKVVASAILTLGVGNQ
jgi:3-hydroxyacyl-[acyl-carrier-protein] dehydratase